MKEQGGSKIRIGIIGLGYVGLPLAAAFGKQFETIGLDINKERVAELKKGYDATLEVSEAVLKLSSQLSYTSEVKDLDGCDFFIVTVPTPIDTYKRPDLTALPESAHRLPRSHRDRPSIHRPQYSLFS